MAHDFKRGDRVEWNFRGRTVRGKVEGSSDVFSNVRFRSKACAAAGVELVVMKLISSAEPFVPPLNVAIVRPLNATISPETPI